MLTTNSTKIYHPSEKEHLYKTIMINCTDLHNHYKPTLQKEPRKCKLIIMPAVGTKVQETKGT